MTGVAAALALCAVLLWVPGLAVVGWLLPHTSRLTRVAVAPAVSFAVLYALASYLDIVGVRVQWQTVALPVVLAGAAGLVVLLRRRGWSPPRVGVEHLLLVLAVLVAYALWWWAIRSPETVPTYDDGANAGIFTHRIGLLGTIAPDKIIATDLGDGAGGVAFYPLALHLVASFLVALTGIEAGAALHVEVATVVAVALPVGAFALTRRLLRLGGPRSLRGAAAAPAAALAAAALPGMPWGQLPWGALALVSGVSLMPAMLLVTLDLPRHGARAGVVLAATVAGVFAVHSSEVVSAAVIGAAMVVALVWRRGDRLRAVLVGATTAVVGTLLLLGPVLPLLGGGLTERSAGTPGPTESTGQAVRDGWISLISAPALGDQWGDRQRFIAWVVTALVVVGILAARRSPVVLAMVAGSGLLAVLAWWALIGSELARRLATPWYANGYRLLATLTVPLVVLVGLGVAWLAGRARVRIVVVALVLSAVALAPAAATCAVIGQRTYAAYSVVTASDRQAYAWLGAHVRPGERVLNDSHDGSMWMYPLADAAPVFGPKSDLWAGPAWDDRWYLLQHAADLAYDRRARAIARDLSVRYIMVGERVIYGESRQLDPVSLAASSALRKVYAAGGAEVFEILP